MAVKKIKMYYYNPVVELNNGDIQFYPVNNLLLRLQAMPVEQRVQPYGEDQIQLQSLNFEDDKWYLSFLRLKDSSVFTTRLNEQAAPIGLDDDEFIGEEVCAIYHINHNIITIQNNRASIGYNSIAFFLSRFIDYRNGRFTKFFFQILTYDRYTEISDEEEIIYKSLIINTTDLSRLRDLLENEDERDLLTFADLGTRLNSISGKLEFSIGRSSNGLNKNVLRNLVNKAKEHIGLIKSIKIKLSDHDTIRLVDLVHNKIEDTITINVTKDDPKTFEKILTQMNAAFDVTLQERLNDLLDVIAVD